MNNSEEHYTIMQPKDLYDSLAEPKMLLVDIRSVQEFNQEHIDGSTNIPKDSLRDHLDIFTEHDYVVLVCDNGKQARHVAGYLHEHGISVHVLEGGIMLWRCCGFPTHHHPLSLPPERKADIVFGVGAVATVGMLLSALPQSVIVGAPILGLMIGTDIVNSISIRIRRRITGRVKLVNSSTDNNQPVDRNQDLFE